MTLAGKIKEQIVGWLRGRKRGSDTAGGGESKRQKMDSQVRSTNKLGKGAGCAAKSSKDGGGRSGGGGKDRVNGGPKGRAYSGPRLTESLTLVSYLLSLRGCQTDNGYKVLFSACF